LKSLQKYIVLQFGGHLKSFHLALALVLVLLLLVLMWLLLLLVLVLLLHQLRHL
jgi:hypothetical protein